MQNEMITYKTVLSDIKCIIDSGRKAAYSAVNSIGIMTYWNIGKRIVENEQQGAERAEYGKQLIQSLANDLTCEYGNTYSKRNLDYYRKFYLMFPDIEIVNACVHNLNWTHFRSFLRVSDDNARILLHGSSISLRIRGIITSTLCFTI